MSVLHRLVFFRAPLLFAMEVPDPAAAEL